MMSAATVLTEGGMGCRRRGSARVPEKFDALFSDDRCRRRMLESEISVRRTKAVSATPWRASQPASAPGSSSGVSSAPVADAEVDRLAREVDEASDGRDSQVDLGTERWPRARRKTWVAAPPEFLLPVHVLGALFRGKFIDGLERLRARGLLKRPFGGAEQVYRYLGRYTHRVAISNAHLVSVDDHAVVFRTRGQDTATVAPVEFIRRFLDHRLPRGFVKIRHGGLLSPTNVNGRLASAKAIIAGRDRCDSDGATVDTVGLVPKIAHLPWADLLLALTGVDLKDCPLCHARAVVRLPLPPDCRGPPDRALPSCDERREGDPPP
jgi:Putative transposase